MELRAIFAKLRTTSDESLEESLKESLGENKLALDSKNSENNLILRAR